MKKVNYNKVYKAVQFILDKNIYGTREITRFIAKKIIKDPKGEVIAKNIYGFDLQLNPTKDISVERSLYYSGTYEKGTLNIISKLLKNGNVFIDVGANIGLMTIYAAYLVGNSGKVISFEANPDTKKILDENIKLNNLKNIEAISTALASENGTSKIYTRWNVGRGGASLIPPSDASEYHEITMNRLDAVLDESIKIDLIKIDIEGYELEALKGFGALLNKDNAPNLIIECSDKRENLNSSREDIYHFLREQNDYVFYKMINGKEKLGKLIKINSIKDMPSHDNIFCFLNENIKFLPQDIF